MQQNIKNLTAELIGLPNKERLEIAGFLLSLDSRTSNSIDTAWEKEIGNRVRAIDAGTESGIDYDKAMQIIDEKFAL